MGVTLRLCTFLEELFARRVYAGDSPVARLSTQNLIQLDKYGARQPDIVLYDPMEI